MSNSKKPNNNIQLNSDMVPFPNKKPKHEEQFDSVIEYVLLALKWNNCVQNSIS